jgi:serine protease Do
MFDLKKPHDIALIILLILVPVLGFGCYLLSQEQHAMAETLAKLEIQTPQQLATQIDVPEVSQIVERQVIKKAESWRDIQDRIADTVVQVFAHVAEINMLMPFQTPQQYSACGSGFFINADGYLVTNAHVINQARAVWIQIPALGRRIIDVEVVGMTPDRDIALLRVKPSSLEVIKTTLGAVPFLPLGDSDTLRRSDEVLALGYPLGQQSLKSTTGVISGHESHLIQISAAINPGSSGGPLLNDQGQVVGINAAGITEAQNVGYAIPINDFKIVETDLYKTKLLHKPFLGILYNNASEAMVEYLGNPEPGGCYCVEVVKGSTLYKAGVEQGDMLYEINGHPVDLYGDMRVPWSEDKISIVDYVSRIPAGEKVHVVIYRKGVRKEFDVAFDLTELPAIRKVYPGYEEIDYEVFGGMVVMQLTINHIQIMEKMVPGLVKFAEMKHQSEPALLITHIFADSQLYRSRTVTPGTTINEVNGVKVSTLEDLRSVLRDSTSDKFLTLRASDNLMRVSDNILVVLPWDRILEEESMLAHDYHYPISSTMRFLLSKRLNHTQFSNPLSLQFS